jgi:hypothetical protein
VAQFLIGVGMAHPSRNQGVDFGRGLVLIAMMIDHVPGNVLEKVTPRNFALADSAEAFVFLSGVSIGLVYYRRVLADGLAPIARLCLKKAAKLYGLHLLLTFCALAIFGAAYWLAGGADALIAPHGRAVVFQEPLRGGLGVALLSHQLGYFNILPLYVVLMALTPLILALARFSAAAALAASLGAYVLVRLTGFDLPSWPEPGGWFFNPFAWQLVFTLGVLAGVRWRDRQPEASPIAQALSLALAAGGTFVVTDGLSFAPGLRDAAFAALDIGKQNLGLARLANFLAIAYLAATTRFFGVAGRSLPGQAVQRLGRHCLPVFAVSSLLSALGQAGAATLGARLDEPLARALEFGYTLACIGALFALASWLEWNVLLRGGALAAARGLLRRSPQSALAQ